MKTSFKTKVVVARDDLKTLHEVKDKIDRLLSKMSVCKQPKSILNVTGEEVCLLENLLTSILRRE